MKVYFALIKNGVYKLHQSSNRNIWEDFINGKTSNIPDIIVAEANDFFKHFNKDGLTVDKCSEFHFWDFENDMEKICNNLLDEELIWTTINIKKDKKL